MKAIRALASFVVLVASIAPAPARNAEKNAYMIRVMSCVGEDASMEIYLPQAPTFKKGSDDLGALSVKGWYTLDLSTAGKGKPLEPVRVHLSADKKHLVLDQYTRGLPRVRIPMEGGVVDFDQRFGRQATCNPFGWHGDEKFGRPER